MLSLLLIELIASLVLFQLLLKHFHILLMLGLLISNPLLELLMLLQGLLACSFSVLYHPIFDLFLLYFIEVSQLLESFFTFLLKLTQVSHC